MIDLKFRLFPFTKRSGTNTNTKNHLNCRQKICAEILYKPVKNSYEIVGLIFSKFSMVFSIILDRSVDKADRQNKSGQVTALTLESDRSKARRHSRELDAE